MNYCHRTVFYGLTNDFCVALEIPSGNNGFYTLSKRVAQARLREDSQKITTIWIVRQLAMSVAAGPAQFAVQVPVKGR